MCRLNLFFKAVRSLAYDVPLLHQLLIASWDEDAVDTLKVIYVVFVLWFYVVVVVSSF